MPSASNSRSSWQHPLSSFNTPSQTHQPSYPSPQPLVRHTPAPSMHPSSGDPTPPRHTSFLSEHAPLCSRLASQQYLARLQLMGMGFINVTLNDELLVKHNYVVEDVVNELMKMSSTTSPHPIPAHETVPMSISQSLLHQTPPLHAYPPPSSTYHFPPVPLNPSCLVQATPISTTLCVLLYLLTVPLTVQAMVVELQLTTRRCSTIDFTWPVRLSY
jgi:hypothetical protein